MKRFQQFIFILCITNNMLSAQDIYDARQSVLLEATLQEDPPRILLSWILDTLNFGYTVFRKNKDEIKWSDTLAILGPAATSWHDTLVTAGQAYDYRVIKALPPPLPPERGVNNGYGFIYAGIKVPPKHHRGSCLLIIDQRFKQSLAPEIQRLLNDMEADGWRPTAIYADPKDSVSAVKSIIQSWAAAHPDIQQALFLLGRIPVPYSGDIAPDGHNSDHKGAWPCDGYYANLDGVWTDQTVNTKAPADGRNDNVPGDGKFDNRIFPTPVQLQVGRVDFANMSKFSESEEQLLRRYLDKDHEWRMGNVDAEERGLVDNNFRADPEGLGQAGWTNFTSMFGFKQVKDLPYRSTLAGQSYLWSYGCGGGGPESASDISSTTHFTTDSLRTVFTMLFGSYFGDWDYPNNFLRAAIASRTVLISTWGSRPNWRVHHLALGEHIGYSTQLTMNNSTLFAPGGYGGFVHIALMGDPTLRMHVLRPVKHLRSVQSGLHVELHWEDSSGSIGYYVYRKTTSDDRYRLLNANPITDPRFVDSCVPSGTTRYMVRNVELRTSASGSYYNLGQGVTTSIPFDSDPYSAKAEFTPSIYFDQLSLTNSSRNGVSFNWDFGDGSKSTQRQPTHLYRQAGSYRVCLSTSDGCQTDEVCQEVRIISSLPLVTAQIKDVACPGAATGAIRLNISGGTTLLDIRWSGLPDTGRVLNQLFAGNYFCTITSETGNSMQYGPFIVRQPPVWNFNPKVTMASAGMSDGTISIDLNGGCPPYTYLWSSGDRTPYLQNLSPGSYCVTVTDCAGCSDTQCFEVKLSSQTTGLTNPLSCSLFPNPVEGRFTITLNPFNNSPVQIQLLDATGRILDERMYLGQMAKMDWDVRTQPVGVYWLRIKCANDRLVRPLVIMRK